MAGGQGGSRRAGKFRTVRMEAFSDGVFAIAITLLVLELEVPSPDDEQAVFELLVGNWPAYLAHVVSFATIGAVWFAHTVITEYLDRANSTLIRLNLLLLMVVAFLPYPTRLLATYIGHTGPERVAAVIYGANLLLAAVLVGVMWRYALHEGLVRPDAADEDIRTLSKRLTPGLAGYLVMIVLGIFLPVVAVFGYLVIAIFIIVPFRELRQHRTRAE
ncbi:MAG TPA: TMEM175 family protein [Actinophytocola sp.]|uniref:TMEM175 family protein n=1 Tax=Actinophytocola sp. TaxID=1872138 RepID=UPI002DB94476|nr:TMEM175 family protein [Actinophytocola sp.]HEU5469133.1 TMEM175 family protein [Actinophytocola sp.]